MENKKIFDDLFLQAHSFTTFLSPSLASPLPPCHPTSLPLSLPPSIALNTPTAMQAPPPHPLTQTPLARGHTRSSKTPRRQTWSPWWNEAPIRPRVPEGVCSASPGQRGVTRILKISYFHHLKDKLQIILIITFFGGGGGGRGKNMEKLAMVVRDKRLRERERRKTSFFARLGYSRVKGD